MPNGGVPINMVVRPQDESDLVIYSHGGDLRIYASADWAANGTAAEPLAQLSNLDAAAIAWFVQYWVGQEALRPGYDRPGFEFDF